jgi:hypothetical protein
LINDDLFHEHPDLMRIRPAGRAVVCLRILS